MRHSFGCDDARFAIPAGLIGSIAFVKYPDTTVALYVLWKALQVICFGNIIAIEMHILLFFAVFFFVFAVGLQCWK